LKNDVLYLSIEKFSKYLNEYSISYYLVGIRCSEEVPRTEKELVFKKIRSNQTPLPFSKNPLTHATTFSSKLTSACPSKYH
jgi:hypothetical protein